VPVVGICLLCSGPGLGSTSPACISSSFVCVAVCGLLTVLEVGLQLRNRTCVHLCGTGEAIVTKREV